MTPEKEQAVKDMKAANKPIAEISRVTGLSRQTCYKVLGLWTRKKEAAK